MIVHVGKNDIMIEKDKFEVLHIESKRKVFQRSDAVTI